MRIEATVDDRGVRALLAALELRGKKPPMKKISVIGLASVLRNFDEQGRPPWPPLSESTTSRPGRGGAGSKPLQDTGALKKSVHTHVTPDNAVIYTDSPYAKYHHQDGADGAAMTMVLGQAGGGKIPKRVFMMWQDEDKVRIRNLLRDHLMGAAS